MASGEVDCYEAYGVAITSTITLPELPRAKGADARLVVTTTGSLGESRVSAMPETAGGVVVDRSGGFARLRFPGVGDFVLSPDWRHIDVRPVPGVPETTIRHLLIDHAVLWALGGQGDLVLHASGVAFPAGAALFLGQSGAGKSTLAAALSQSGRPVLCDDGARLVAQGRGYAVAPAYPGLRLWPDGVDTLLDPATLLGEVAHDSAKRRWIPGAMPRDPVPLACLFLLSELSDSGDIVEVGEQSSRDAVVYLLDQTFQLPGGGREDVRQHFDRITALVEAVPALRLAYPYDFSKLGEVVDLVESTMAGMV